MRPIRTNLLSWHKSGFKNRSVNFRGIQFELRAAENAKYIFLSATLDAAIWGVELAWGEGLERIYLVELTGAIEDDPDLTDKKFPGNPSKSYRSTHPFKLLVRLPYGRDIYRSK